MIYWQYKNKQQRIFPPLVSSYCLCFIRRDETFYLSIKYKYVAVPGKQREAGSHSLVLVGLGHSAGYQKAHHVRLSYAVQVNLETEKRSASSPQFWLLSSLWPPTGPHQPGPVGRLTTKRTDLPTDLLVPVLEAFGDLMRLPTGPP